MLTCKISARFHSPTEMSPDRNGPDGDGSNQIGQTETAQTETAQTESARPKSRVPSSPCWWSVEDKNRIFLETLLEVHYRSQIII